MKSRRVCWSVLAGTLALALNGCDEAARVMCSDELRTVRIAAVDSTGAAVAGAFETSTLIRTGQVLPITAIMDPVPGHYVILDDGDIPHLHPGGDSIAVSLVLGEASAGATYHFDVPNGCHINKVSGPDTLVVR